MKRGRRWKGRSWASGPRQCVLAARSEIVREEAATVAALVSKGLERRPRFPNLQRETADIDGRRGRSSRRYRVPGKSSANPRQRLLKLEHDRQNEIARSLREAQNQIFPLRERLRDSRRQFSRTGQGARGRRSNRPQGSYTGRVIGTGVPLMDLVPLQDGLIVIARVRPEDIDVVRPGLRADVQLLPYNQRRVPRFHGDRDACLRRPLGRQAHRSLYYAAKIRVRPAGTGHRWCPDYSWDADPGVHQDRSRQRRALRPRLLEVSTTHSARIEQDTSEPVRLKMTVKSQGAVTVRGSSEAPPRCDCAQNIFA